MTAIDFAEMPVSRLFRDFIARLPLLSQFFPHFQEAERTIFEKRLSQSFDREKLADAIRTSMNIIEEYTPEQSKNLELLKNPNTLAVITGQQIGLYGGPIYTIVKAMSAVQLAKKFQAENSDLAFIPIFWIENNDHDLAETASVTMLNRQTEAEILTCVWSESPTRIPVSEIRYDAHISALNARLEEMLPHGEYSALLEEKLRSWYAEGALLSETFVQYLQEFLGESGVLFVSAAELQKRGMFGDISRREIAAPGETQKLVEATSKVLEESGYHAQAQASPLNLFLAVEGQRHKLTLTENGFSAGHRLFSREELALLAQNEPERFSPNVLLRPLMQDVLFPTAAYIAGPGEIAYWAQISGVYRHFGLTEPIVAPRHSLTLLEPKTLKTMNERKMNVPDFLHRWEDVEKRVVEQLEDKRTAAEFERVKAEVSAKIAELSDIVVAVDKTLESTLGRAKAMATQELDNLLGKVRKAEKRNEQTTLGKIRQTHSSVYPANSLQERSLSLVYFLAKYGKKRILEAIFWTISAEPTSHLLLVIENFNEFSVFEKNND